MIICRTNMNRTSRYLFHLPQRITTASFIALMTGAAMLAGAVAAGARDSADPPLHLHETGLFAPGSPAGTGPGVMPFTPQYALWSDGAAKRRWLYLPPGTQIDAANPDAWEFPRGTRLWKEFAHDRAVETRYIERRADGTWQYATYLWNADGSEAVLAPVRGVRAMPVNGAPDGRYDIPSQADCTVCHEGAAVPVLGVGALQLSPDRDPAAAPASLPGAGDLDLPSLVARGLIRNLPPALLVRPPRIAADTPTERAALGYLHGNCGHCHNDNGSPAPVGLILAQSVADAAASREQVRRSAIDSPSRFRPQGAAAPLPIIKPARPDESVLGIRMRSRNPAVQMPPLGTHAVDPAGTALIDRWISQLKPHKEL